MNRRSFMRMLGIGVPAAAVLTKVPVVEEAMGVAPEVPMFAQGVTTMSCTTTAVPFNLKPVGIDFIITKADLERYRLEDNEE